MNFRERESSKLYTTEKASYIFLHPALLSRSQDLYSCYLGDGLPVFGVLLFPVGEQMHFKLKQ